MKTIYCFILTIGLITQALATEGDHNIPSSHTSNLPQEKNTVHAKSTLERGQQYADTAKVILGKNLLQAIQNRGTVGALNFCNENAIPLTNSSVSDAKINIKRVSDLNRNPNNAANTKELNYILAAKQLLNQKKKVPPLITKNKKSTIGYYPIVTNQMCLQCHGQAGTEIAADTFEKIQQLYPKDKAVGYGVNELRGIWVVEMSD